MNIPALSALALALGLCGPALAQQAGDWTLGLGLHQVNPKSGNGVLAGAEAEIGSSLRPTVTFEYFIRDNVGVEVLAALPFSHKVELAGLGEVGVTKHLPPVVSLQYHFATGGKVTPFLGLGVNYTAFFEEEARGPLAGSTLKIENSWGLAAHAGIDYAIGDRAAVRADLRWIDIEAEVLVDGAPVGTASIDPLVYGLAYVMKF